MAQENKSSSVWPAVGVMAVLLLACVFYVSYRIDNIKPAEAKVDLSNMSSKADLESFKKDVLGMLNKTDVSDGSFTLSKEEFEDQAIETKALELATESVNSRDFKEAVYALLVNSNNSVYDSEIESYKDITEVKIKEADVDDDEVEFEVIVYYYQNDDEENTMKAYLENFFVSVDHLDFDEEFEDAEVDEDYMDNLVITSIKEK